MLLDDVWTLFEDALFDVPSTDTLFNPYHDAHDALGRPGAAQIRRDNLRRYLEAYPARPPLMLVAEAPGPWGCRFSGVPLTSEAQLLDPAHPLDGLASSRADEPHTEYSGSIFWRVLQPVFPHFFVWNSVPLHPHDAGAPLTIRTPRRSEVARWQPLLRDLLDGLAPERVVAVGRKAERALKEVDAAPTYVRHPSQGGAKTFEAGVTAIVEAMGLREA
jgi:uracil-DNA glycosylase